MANKIHHFEGFSIVDGDIKVKLNMDRLSDQFNKAQYELDSAVMTSMVPFMPMQDGTFIQRTVAESASIAGTGEVVAGVPPQGRFLYEGKVMVDSQTGKGPMRFLSKYGEETFRFRKGAKLKPTNRELRYSKSAHPKAQSHWFDAAKERDLNAWISKTKKIAGGG